MLKRMVLLVLLFITTLAFADQVHVTEGLQEGTHEIAGNNSIELKSLLTGNRFDAVFPGKVYDRMHKEYVYPRYSLKFHEDNKVEVIYLEGVYGKKAAGTWSLKEGKLCLKFNGRKFSAFSRCAKVVSYTWQPKPPIKHLPHDKSSRKIIQRLVLTFDKPVFINAKQLESVNYQFPFLGR